MRDIMITEIFWISKIKPNRKSIMFYPILGGVEQKISLSLAKLFRYFGFNTVVLKRQTKIIDSKSFTEFNANINKTINAVKKVKKHLIDLGCNEESIGMMGASLGSISSHLSSHYAKIPAIFGIVGGGPFSELIGDSIINDEYKVKETFCKNNNIKEEDFTSLYNKNVKKDPIKTAKLYTGDVFMISALFDKTVTYKYQKRLNDVYRNNKKLKSFSRWRFPANHITILLFGFIWVPLAIVFFHRKLK